MKATKRENNLFLFMSGVTNLKFVADKVCVSEGQEADDVVSCSIAEDGVSWKLTFMAGRYGTKNVAETFINMITSSDNVTGASVGCCTSESSPEKLNFAYKGTLSFTYHDTTLNRDIYCEGKDIVFAQGHNNDDKNNWWVGGRLMRNVLDVKYAKAVSQVFDGTVASNGILTNQVLMFVPRPTEPNEFAISIVGL